ncbi:hypothetical protein CK203_004650 [Vitis vinifera]|uniref:Uncharacterized protein n=1 Tax=Vitis vinifera TaxID=29760 RepID=A0A438KGT2_VITVI|nr:hypothetical protein CK203_004650 [Vitis vinifera]
MISNQLNRIPVLPFPVLNNFIDVGHPLQSVLELLVFISRAFQKAPELVCVLSWILLIPLDCVLSLGTLKLVSRAKLENCALGMQCLSMLGRGRQLKKGKFIRAGIRMRKEQLDEGYALASFWSYLSINSN